MHAEEGKKKQFLMFVINNSNGLFYFKNQTEINAGHYTIEKTITHTEMLTKLFRNVTSLEIGFPGKHSYHTSNTLNIPRG